MAEMSLEQRIQRVEDILEVQNLMGRYSHLHAAERQKETVELWSERPDCRIEMAWGVYEGSDAAERCYLQDHAYPVIGAMHVHTLTTPVIEIAGDGKTAKGVWISPGVETSTVLEEKLTANWAWLKYGADFVKEDGKWKFWHLHVYGMFRCSYDKPWTEAELPTWGGAERASQRHNDRPPTGQHEYQPTKEPVLVPAPPEPYETFDEKTGY